VYENSEGLQVGLSASSAWWDLQTMIEGDYSTLDMGEYGLMYFQGQPGAYYRAVYGPEDFNLGFYVELWFINAPINQRRGIWDLRFLPSGTGIDSSLSLHGAELFSPVPREDLEGFVQIFNPSALARQYRWELMPWQ